MKINNAVLDGVPIKTLNGTHCATECPLLAFDGMTVCGLERNKQRKSRYDKAADAWSRCPECLKLERKG